MPDPYGFPDVLDAERVGDYPALAKCGGGYVWDEVLEYRVWCHPERGAEDLADGNDYYHAFASYPEALEFSQETIGAERSEERRVGKECRSRRGEKGRRKRGTPDQDVIAH